LDGSDEGISIGNLPDVSQSGHIIFKMFNDIRAEYQIKFVGWGFLLNIQQRELCMDIPPRHFNRRFGDIETEQVSFWELRPEEEKIGAFSTSYICDSMDLVCRQSLKEIRKYTPVMAVDGTVSLHVAPGSLPDELIIKILHLYLSAILYAGLASGNFYA
jgi:hypothetical protein